MWLSRVASVHGVGVQDCDFSLGRGCPGLRPVCLLQAKLRLEPREHGSLTTGAGFEVCSIEIAICEFALSKTGSGSLLTAMLNVPPTKATHVLIPNSKERGPKNGVRFTSAKNGVRFTSGACQATCRLIVVSFVLV